MVFVVSAKNVVMLKEGRAFESNKDILLLKISIDLLQGMQDYSNLEKHLWFSKVYQNIENNLLLILSQNEGSHRIKQTYQISKTHYLKAKTVKNKDKLF